MATIPAAQRKLVTTHDALGAYARRYGLQVIATVMGAPSQDLPPEAQGFTIERHYYTMAGEEVSPSTVKQSDILVVVLSGKSDADVYN